MERRIYMFWSVESFSNFWSRNRIFRVFNFSSDRLLLAKLWLFLYFRIYGPEFTVRNLRSEIYGPKSKIWKIRVSIFSSIGQILAELRLFRVFGSIYSRSGRLGCLVWVTVVFVPGPRLLLHYLGCL